MNRLVARVFAPAALAGLLLMSACLTAGPGTGRRGAVQPTLTRFAGRVEHARRELPGMIAAAEAVAERLVTHTNLLIDVPYWPQQSFAEEMLNRAGGLALALPTVERPKEATPHDVVLFSMRAWESAKPDEVEKRLALLREYREKGLLVVLFAPRAGMPDGVVVDFLIDSGAAGPGEDEAAVNALANAMNGWIWTCEFVAAMTRRGKCPAILMSALREGSAEHNAPIQTRAGRHTLNDCDMPVPAGELAEVYLARMDALVAELAGARVQEGLREGGELVASRLRAGKRVAVASCSHFLLAEIFSGSQTPWQPFNAVWQTKKGVFEKNAGPGDLLVWFGFQGLSTPYEDYGAHIRASGADLVASFKEDRGNPANNAPFARVYIAQTWDDHDAAVAIPCPPGGMAPSSGIEQGLLYRMLDDEAADRLGRRRATVGQ